MLDVSLLGTAGMMPLPYRFLTSLMARYNGSDLLIDCGEGTQVAIAKKGWSPHSIDTLLLTHYHADHCGAFNELYPEYKDTSKFHLKLLSDGVLLLLQE